MKAVSPKSTPEKTQLRGIILAGGSGTRLYPITQAISKQLLPIYSKPMLYYPLSALMLADIREILIITTPHEQPLFKKLLGDGAQWGMTFSYAIQDQPRGIAESLVIAEDFLDGHPSVLILGDNLFYGHDFPQSLSRAREKIISGSAGAVIFGYQVTDPERYGVVEFDSQEKPVALLEKPKNAPSNWAVTGIYFYDGTASAIARQLAPSARGELEITDLNNVYLKKGTLQLEKLGRGIAWLDTGTFGSLLQASSFIEVLEERQGLMISCPEEIAFRKGFIDATQLELLGKQMSKNSYGQYLLRVAEEFQKENY